MKKTIGILLGIIILAFIAITIWNNENSIENNITTVGAVFPTSKAAKEYGEISKRGVEIALEVLNSNEPFLNVLYKDSEADQVLGANKIEELISVNKVPAIITFVSGVVLAGDPITDSSKVVMLNTLAQNPKINLEDDFTFSLVNDANVETFKMADYAYDSLNIRNMAIVSCSASYGVGAKDAMIQRFTEKGGQIVYQDEFDENSTNFTSIIENLKGQGADAVFAPGISTDIAFLIKQAAQRGYETQWLSFTSFEGDDVLEVAGVAAEGVIFTSTTFDPLKSPSAKTFVDKYKEKYGETPKIYAATAYDATILIGNAIKADSKNGPSIKNYLEELGEYKGASGMIKFDENGAVSKPVLFKTIRRGKFEFL